MTRQVFRTLRYLPAGPQLVFTLNNRFFRHQACYSLLPAKPGGEADRVVNLRKYKVVGSERGQRKEKGPELEFLKSLWGLGTEEAEGSRTGPPCYIGWRIPFLGIDSGAP
jgi:hypothetical protein